MPAAGQTAHNGVTDRTAAVSPAASVTSSWCSAHGHRVSMLRSRFGGGGSSTWTQLHDLVAAATAELDGISSPGGLAQHHAQAAAAATDGSHGTEPHCAGRPVDLAEVERLAAEAMACVDGALAHALCLRPSGNGSASLGHLRCDKGSEAGALWRNNVLWTSGASTHSSSQDSCRQQPLDDGQSGDSLGTVTQVEEQLQQLKLLCSKQAAALEASKARELECKAYCMQLEVELVEAHHDLQSAEAQLAAIEAAAARQQAVQQQKHRQQVWALRQQVGELQQLMAEPFFAASSGSAASSVTTSTDSYRHPFVKGPIQVSARASAPAAAGSSSSTAAAAEGRSATPPPKKALPPAAGLRGARSEPEGLRARQEHASRRVSSSSAPPARRTPPASSALLRITSSSRNVGAAPVVPPAGRRPLLSVDVRALRDAPIKENARYCKSAGAMMEAGTAGSGKMMTSGEGRRGASDDTCRCIARG